MFATEGFFTVFGKTGILLGNPDTPIERSHRKKSKMIDALVQKIQLDEHGKFRYYVMFATMDMLMLISYGSRENRQKLRFLKINFSDLNFFMRLCWHKKQKKSAFHVFRKYRLKWSQN
jgi:hypothetical protein